MSSASFRGCSGPGRRCFDPGGFSSQKLPLNHSQSFFNGVIDSSGRTSVKPKDLSGNGGFPVISFNNEEVSVLASPFEYTLIGNFSSSVPIIAKVAPVLKSLCLKGKFCVSFLDSRRLCLRFIEEEDFFFVRSKCSLWIAGCYMTLLDWSPSFTLSVDSPIMSSWVTLKNLPFMFFHPEALYEIVKLLGKPIRVDDATANMSRLDRVRVCVELDVSKPILNSLYVVYLGIECEVKVYYDYVPLFCDFCCKLGHKIDSCCAATSDLGPQKELFGSVPSHLGSSNSSEVLNVSGNVLDVFDEFLSAFGSYFEPEPGEVPKGNCVDVSDSLESSSIEDSDITSLSVQSGSKHSIGNHGCTEYSEEGTKVVLESDHFSDELIVFPFTFDSYFDSEVLDIGKSDVVETDKFPLQFENYFEPEPGEKYKVSEESLLMAVGEELSKIDEFENYGLYPYPLLVDVNSGVPEFEPGILTHRRRKSVGDFRSFEKSLSLDSYEACGSRSVGYREELFVPDLDAYFSPDYDDCGSADFTSFGYDYD